MNEKLEVNMNGTRIRLKDIPEYLKVSKSTAQRIVNEMTEEINKPDSKLPRNSVIGGNGAKWVRENSLNYYVENRDTFKDSNARKRLRKMEEN